MARKQKSKGFNKFLDLIGLVDTDTQEADFDGEYDKYDNGHPPLQRDHR